MQQPVTLEGRRILLVPFSEAFINATYLSWLQDEQTSRYLVKGGPDVTLEDVRAFCQQMLTSEQDFFFAILLKEGRRHIGNVRLGPVDWQQGYSDFGLMIGESAWRGQGLGGEVMGLIKSFAFERLQLRGLAFHVVKEYRAAIALYEKQGFFQARAEKRFVKGGESREMVLFTLDNPLIH